MDPNATYQEALSLALSLVNAPDEDVARLAELFLSLTGWLASGGFQPAWKDSHEAIIERSRVWHRRCQRS